MIQHVPKRQIGIAVGVVLMIALFSATVAYNDYKYEQQLEQEEQPQTDNATPPTLTNTHNTSEPDLDFTAKVICQDMVREYLKAPSTAEFDASSQPKRQGDTDRYVWESHVDAQNSFGAQIRTGFTCAARCTSSYRCVDIELKFDER